MYPTRLTCRKREVALKFQGNLYNLLLVLKSDSMIIGSQPFHSTYTFYNELGRYVSQKMVYTRVFKFMFRITLLNNIELTASKPQVTKL